MEVGHPRRAQSEKSAVQLAVDAVVGPDPLGPDVLAIDPSPTALGLDDGDESKLCSNSRCSRPGAEACIVCGQSPSEERIAEDED